MSRHFTNGDLQRSNNPEAVTSFQENPNCIKKWHTRMANIEKKKKKKEKIQIKDVLSSYLDKYIFMATWKTRDLRILGHLELLSGTCDPKRSSSQTLRPPSSPPIPTPSSTSRALCSRGYLGMWCVCFFYGLQLKYLRNFTNLRPQQPANIHP